mgnify:CR=1 FL=1
MLSKTRERLRQADDDLEKLPKSMIIAKKIRKIDLQTYSIKDYKIFDEPVRKFFRVLGKEYVLLDSGFYML